MENNKKEPELTFVESGRTRKAVEKECPVCGNKFLARKNNGKTYCDVVCRGKAKRTGIECKCRTCGKMVYRNESKIKNSKSGVYFCGRVCKDVAQSIDGNCPEIRPDHYGYGDRSYWRNKILTESCSCIGCGEDRKFLIQMHHKDGDSENNVVENLEIVCANCHVCRHILITENGWVHSTRCLTPKESIDTL